jgi:hypothetical protein
MGEVIAIKCDFEEEKFVLSLKFRKSIYLKNKPKMSLVTI